MIEIILNLVEPIIIAIIAAYFAAKWAISKFYTERWWEKKEKAYTELIESITNILIYLDLKVDESLDPNIFMGPDENITNEYTSSYWKLKKATITGSFTLSKEAEDLLVNLSNREKLSLKENAPFEVYEQEIKYFKNALTKIKEIANKDLKSK